MTHKSPQQVYDEYREVCLELRGTRLRITELNSALEWYAEHVAGCRKLGRDGDIARGKLDRDGGTKALEALKGEKS